MTTPLSHTAHSAQGTASITSPVELTQFVESMLNDLEAKFDTLSEELLGRLGGLAERVDTLEGSIKELMEEPSSEIISHDEQQPR